MNAEIFRKWFEELSIKCKDLYGKCAILMDNAGYHKTRVSDSETFWPNRTVSTALKSQLAEFLKAKGEKNIATWTRSKLYKRAQEIITTLPREVEKIAATYGHRVVFTPPYWPEFNGIETIWGVMKNYVAKHQEGYDKKGVTKLIHEAVAHCTEKTWKSVMDKQYEYEESKFEDLEIKNLLTLISERANVRELLGEDEEGLYNDEGILDDEDDDGMDVD